MGTVQHAGIFLPALRAAALGTLLFMSPRVFAAPPDATSLSPAGGEIGKTVNVTATGTFNTWPIQTWTSEAKVGVECEKEKGKLKIHIAPDAQPGLVWLRFIDAEGTSMPRPFVVSSLPSVLEKEPNDAPKQAQEINSAVVVQGKFDKNGDSDSYRIELTAGQTLVASLQSNQIFGSPADGALQICSADGQVLAMNQDAGGLDSLISFQARTAGTYLVRTFALPAVPNSSINFAGGELFIYRLTITTGAFADYALPLGVSRTEPTALLLKGWNVASEPLLVSAPGSFSSEPWYWSPLPGGGLIPLKISDHPLVVAGAEATSEAGQNVHVPAVISGVISQPREIHRFAFESKMGAKLALAAESANLDFDLDPFLKLIAPDGKLVAEVDDAGKERDPRLNVTLPTDGRYVAEIRDLHRSGGPRHVYRLTIEPPQPRLSLSVAAGSFLIEAGKMLEIPVTVTRQNGFSDEVTITAVDLPPGVSVIFATSENKKDSAKQVKVILTAAEDAQAGPIRIIARKADESELTVARFSQTLGGSKFEHASVWLAVKGKDKATDKGNEAK